MQLLTEFLSKLEKDILEGDDEDLLHHIHAIENIINSLVNFKQNLESELDKRTSNFVSENHKERPGIIEYHKTAKELYAINYFKGGVLSREGKMDPLINFGFEKIIGGEKIDVKCVTSIEILMSIRDGINSSIELFEKKPDNSHLN